MADVDDESQPKEKVDEANAWDETARSGSSGRGKLMKSQENCNNLQPRSFFVHIF